MIYTRFFGWHAFSRHWLCKLVFRKFRLPIITRPTQKRLSFSNVVFFSAVFHFDFGAAVSQSSTTNYRNDRVCAHNRMVKFIVPWLSLGRVCRYSVLVYMNSIPFNNNTQHTSTESVFFSFLRLIFHLKRCAHARSSIPTLRDSNAETHLWP